MWIYTLRPRIPWNVSMAIQNHICLACLFILMTLIFTFAITGAGNWRPSKSSIKTTDPGKLTLTALCPVKGR
jgi:hypothetical protein